MRGGGGIIMLIDIYNWYSLFPRGGFDNVGRLK